MVKIIQKRATTEGLLSLYHGFNAALPHAVVQNTVQFVLLEVLAQAFKHKLIYTLAVAVPTSVVVSNVVAAPFEQLRKIMVANPFDFETFMYDEDGRMSPD